MRVLGLCSYPVESAATRFRMAQYVAPLRERGIELTIEPFLDSEQFKSLYKGGAARKIAGLAKPLAKRLAGVFKAGKYDLLFVQREAMFFGPGLFEWLYKTIADVPMVLDLDDATYVRYVSPSYGRLGSYLKFFGKTDQLIERSSLVVCGNRFIAEYVESTGRKAVVVPTVVDTDEFVPVEKKNDPPVVGWIGTHSTFPFLETIFPVLEELAKEHRFKLKIVGAGRSDVRLDGVEVENLDWSLERERVDFQYLDIGLYPIALSSSANEQWVLGKSGFKAIQYLAVGVPFVMTPVGVCAEIGIPNRTHFNAVTPEDWYTSLDGLLSNAGLRREMGDCGRRCSLEDYTVGAQADIMARSLRSASGAAA